MEPLAQRVAALEAAIDPQTMRNALERTQDPRGGEPRIIDAAGRTLDFQGAIQLLGGTAVVNSTTQRVIYTPTPASTTYRFSEDTTPGADEQIAFVSETNAPVANATISTITSTDAQLRRRLTLQVTGARPAGSPITKPTSAIDMHAAAATGAASAQVDITTDGNTNESTSIQSRSRVGASTSTSVAVSASGGVGNDGVVSIAGSGGNGASGATVSCGATGAVAANSFVTAQVNAIARTLIDGNTRSSYLQVCANAGSTPSTPIQSVMRGPFLASPGVLAPGASVTVLVAGAFPVAAVTVAAMGAVTAAAGSLAELVVWSWARNGATGIDITFTNTGAGAHTVTLPFFTISDV